MPHRQPHGNLNLFRKVRVSATRKDATTMLPRRALLDCLVPSFLASLLGATVAHADDPPSADAAKTLNIAVLRQAGCIFDGRHDDAPVLQRVLDEAAQRTDPGTAVTVDLPPGRIRLGAPIRTGSVDLVLRGAGRDATIVTTADIGAWVHGDETQPARGTLSITGVSFEDVSAAKHPTVGLSVWFAPSVADGCLSLQGLGFRGWFRAAMVSNATRGWLCRDMLVVGPDNAMQPDAGILVRSTPRAERGCFDYMFESVMVSNYRWGWRYEIGAVLEGQVFRDCHAYNGQGLLSVDCRLSNYRSLLWALTDCDAEGTGPLIDLAGCRDISLRGGFMIASAQKTVPLVIDNTLALLRLRNCVDVVTDHVEFDATPNARSGLSVVFCDGDCRRVRFRDTTITVRRPFRAGFQWAPNVEANTIAELDTVWAAWSDGPRLLDGSGNQVAQSMVRLTHDGDVTADGLYTLHGCKTASPASDGRLTIALPTRAGGRPLFIDGPPEISFSVEQAGDAAFTLTSIARDGFVLRSLSAAGRAVKVHWSATGR